MAKKPALSPEEARAEALGTALATIERKYGKGAVMKLSDEAHVNIPVIPTGSIGLDLALGVGGIPRGRITEIFGPESSGKTTLTLHIIAECQKMGGTCAFVDAEHALDVNYARHLGVNTDELLISQPDYGEQALDIADMLVRSGMNFDPGKGYNLSRGGNYWRGTIFGHGNVPTFQILSAIRKSGYDGYVSLEFEGMEPVLEGVEIGTQNLQHMIKVIGEGQRYV